MIAKFVKSFFVSKTIGWAGLLMAAYLALQAFGMDVQEGDVDQITGLFGQLIEHADTILIIGGNLVAIGIRWITKKPIEEKL